MTALPVNVLITLQPQVCGVAGCGVHFALESTFLRKMQDTGAFFFCPRGHEIHFTETNNDRLRKQIAAKDAELEKAARRLEFEKNRREAAEKEAATARKGQRIVSGKLKAQSHRVKHGVCPCCHRTFQALARHMETKHPEWKGP